MEKNKNLCDDYKNKEDHIELSELTAFRCTTCNSLIAMGRCGEHRTQTGHKDFESVYNKKTENDTI